MPFSASDRFTRWLERQSREYQGVTIREWTVRPSGAHNIYNIKFDMNFPRGGGKGNAYCAIKDGWHRHSSVYGTIRVVMSDDGMRAIHAKVRFCCYCGKAPPGKRLPCCDPASAVAVSLDGDVAADVAEAVAQQVTGMFREGATRDDAAPATAASTSSAPRLGGLLDLKRSGKKRPAGRVVKRREVAAEDEEEDGSQGKRLRVGSESSSMAPEMRALVDRMMAGRAGGSGRG